jgi:hypothetical protein
MRRVGQQRPGALRSRQRCGVALWSRCPLIDGGEKLLVLTALTVYRKLQFSRPLSHTQKNSWYYQQYYQQY